MSTRIRKDHRMNLENHPAIVEAREALEQEHGPFLTSQAEDVDRIIAAAVEKVCREMDDRLTHLRGLLCWADAHIERKGGVHSSDEYGIRMYAAVRAANSFTIKEPPCPQK